MADTDEFEKNQSQLGVRNKIQKYAKSTFSMKTVHTRLPITYWLPRYQFSYIAPDIIAGITVGLTAIPQGIAYAVVAGLTPEYGLYAGMMSGFVYLFFGSVTEITIGPTAIMAALIATYVSNFSTDFAILGGFLCGVVILTMGILHLGFLVEFISEPVISGFTTAAALQIASAQLRSTFGLDGPSGSTFAESVYYFFKNITTARLWESMLSFGTIGMLLLLQWFGKGCNRNDGFLKSSRWFIALSRNAIVVIVGMIIAFSITVASGDSVIGIIGDIGSGIPSFSLPPFTSVVDGEVFNFGDMLRAFGPQFFTLPLVAILTHVSISKAFAGGIRVDATQEMIALGLCNIIGSFFGAMPITGSFTRTALNSASGVRSQAGGIFTGLLLILALSLLTATFFYIPRATLAGVIMTAMFSMIDYDLMAHLWRNSKKELVILALTMIACMFLGLEIGILIGVGIDAAVLLYTTARPKLMVKQMKSESGEAYVIPLTDSVSYCAADHVRRAILKASRTSNLTIIVDATELKNMDTTVALNLNAVVKELTRIGRTIIFLNFKPMFQKMCLDLNAKNAEKFVTANDINDCLAKISVGA